MIDLKYKTLRKLLRTNSTKVINYLIKTHIDRIHIGDKSRIKKDICSFCGSSNLLSREHVLPKWAYENCDKTFFITDINGLSQTYNKTTIPACSFCNNDLLGSIENHIIQLLKNSDLANNDIPNYEKENVIRWLEIIEYKFQVLEVRRTFKTSKDNGYIPFLADFPVTVMRGRINYSPFKATTQLRQSNKRLSIKSKAARINSLVVFRTKNERFYFLHTLNDFVFIELPQYKVAFFYFYQKEFETNFDAHKEAIEIITRIMNQNE